MSGNDVYMKKEWDNSAIVAARAMPAKARVPAELHIGNVRIAPATVLATMPKSPAIHVDRIVSLICSIGSPGNFIRQACLTAPSRVKRCPPP